jgi:hypothetical protein
LVSAAIRPLTYSRVPLKVVNNNEPDSTNSNPSVAHASPVHVATKPIASPTAKENTMPLPGGPLMNMQLLCLVPFLDIYVAIFALTLCVVEI